MPQALTTDTPDPAAPAPTILVVDDNRINRDLMRHILEPEGYKVLEAADGDTGVKLARSKIPACVLLDIRMPGLDGFAVLDRLKQDPTTREIPVFALTATADEVSEVQRALAAGAAGYLLKPLDIQDTLARVHGAIERHRSALET